MGVPAFFRWLTKKYPSVVADCVEQQPIEINDEKIYADSSEPNPNNVEFDNLYLDMNGIIHPCTHPENKPAPKNEDEMMIAIFECIDRLFRIVRPRKVLYMAIDGVAPRAKMNQQRSRRFRASKETYEKITEITRIREELLSKGVDLPPEKPKAEHFDSNCITPGTPFMARLSICLHYYIHDRLNNDPGWKGIKIILSDANVPGEGEHKIMDYIRKQRAQPEHDPNTQHVLCGADADLIMLGLATHEPNFTIIREEFKPNQPRPCEICGQVGHDLKSCVGGVKQEEEEVISFAGSEPNFIFVRLAVLREYLEKELNIPNLPFPFDLERAIDDWVFMCFFVGNDFLPHLPSLEIREGAIDRLVKLYKDAVFRTRGYLTNSGDVNLDRVQLIMSQLGEAEDSIFQNRHSQEQYWKERNKADKRRKKMMRDFGRNATGQFAPQALGRGLNVAPVQNPRTEAYNMRVQSMNTGIEAMLRPEGSAPVQENDSESEPEPEDEVRLYETGFKERYYESKFNIPPEDQDFRHKVALEYVRGLCWVLRYYYQGCASWKWYFPYHYAPFASDFVNISVLSTEFEKGTIPFRPLEQLMSVFPAASSGHVPAPWAELMSDPDSEIIDFYPIDFKIDLNGKRFAWQGVALLPFVDETRLFKALEPYYDLLTTAEKNRNIRGDDRLYVGKHHPEFNFFKTLYETSVSNTLEEEYERVMEGVKGRILLATDRILLGGSMDSPVKGLYALEENQVITVRFRDPKYDEDYIFPAKRLKGAVEPPRVLKPGDYDPDRNGPFRPQIGVGQSRQRGYLGRAGHRMLNAGVRNWQDRDRDRSNQGQDRDRSYRDREQNRDRSQQSDYMNQVPPSLAPQQQQQQQQQGYFTSTAAMYQHQQTTSQGWRVGDNSRSFNTSSSESYGYAHRGGYNAGPGGQQRFQPYNNRQGHNNRGRGGGGGYRGGGYNNSSNNQNRKW